MINLDYKIILLKIHNTEVKLWYAKYYINLFLYNDPEKGRLSICLSIQVRVQQSK